VEEADRLSQTRVCAKSGVPADVVIEMRAVHTPSWIWILLFFGILPMLIAYAFTKEVAIFDVPASTEVAERRKRTSRYMFATVIASALLLGMGAVSGTEGYAWLGVAGLVGVTMALPFAARTWINAAYDGEWVHLSRLHPHYVQAVGSSS
jgi:hypothetical protein